MRKYDFKGFSVKNVKKNRGHEGEPCPYGSICFNGKKVGEFAYDSWGGPMNIRFTDETAKAAFGEAVAAMPQVEFYGSMLAFNDEMLIEEMVTEFDLKKDCKKKTLFLLDDTEKNSVMEMKTPYGPDIKAYLHLQYGAKLVEIINERWEPAAQPIAQEVIDKATKTAKPLTPVHVCLANVSVDPNAIRAAVTVSLVKGGFKAISADYIDKAPKTGNLEDELAHAVRYVSLGLENKVA